MTRQASEPQVFSSADGFRHIVKVLSTRYMEPSAAATARPAVVVVLGAGASLWSGMPLWKWLKNPIVDVIRTSLGGLDVFVDEAWRKLPASIGYMERSWTPSERFEKLLKNASLDEICSVACEYDVVRDRIRDKLRNVYTQVYDFATSAGALPQLGYELLAHLLKHGFIDHIITFNFDELLDTALANEMPGEYDLITSEHQLPASLEPVRPRVFKLHGTISADGSLRFTSRQTGILSYEMVSLLDATLFGSNSHSEDGSAERRVHVISLGYSWRDPDFARWAVSRANRIESLTVVDLEGEAAQELRSRVARDNSPACSTLCVRGIAARDIASTPAAPVSTDHLLWALWNRVEAKLKHEGSPFIPASRHIILGSVFRPRNPPNGEPDRDEFLRDPRGNLNFMNQHDCKKRFRIEVLLHLAKCKGMVCASVMAGHTRINQYYQKLASKQAGRCDPMEELQKIIAQSPYPDVKETYLSTAKALDDLVKHFMDGDEFSVLNVPVPRFDESTGKVIVKSEPAQDFFCEHVTRIFEAPEVEVVHEPARRGQWLFRDAKPLDSYLALQLQTRKLLQKSWTHLLVVAESGSWLTTKEIYAILKRAGGQRILLLEASTEQLGEWHLRTQIGTDLKESWAWLRKNQGLAITHGYLSWWQHNRHLTLAVDLKSDGCFAGGIYFRRELKASRIAPVYVADASDCAELLITFMSYVRRACRENADVNQSLKSAASELCRKVKLPPEFRDRLEGLL